MKPKLRRALVVLLITLAVSISACAAPPATTSPTPVPVQPTSTQAPMQDTTPTAEPTQDPEFALPDFSSARFDDPTNITHKYFPLTPGMELVLDGFTEELGRKIPHTIIFTVTDLIKEIAGIETRVAYILDFSDGELVEAEVAFYAQDNDGNVWFMGEYPEVYEDGKMVEAPAWIPGFKGAQAGIVMKADPQLGLPSYGQGWGPAVNWTDRGRVVALGEKNCVPVDCYEDVLVTEEFSQAEPDAFQVKYYAPGVGNFRVGWRGEDATKETLELVKLTKLDEAGLAEVRAKALELEQSAYKNSKEVYAPTKPAYQDMSIK